MTELEGSVDDPVLVRDLISAFLADAPGLIGKLRSGLEQGEPDEVRRAAHTLKSNGRTFGATSLAVLSEQLELKAKSRSMADAADLVAEIEHEYTRVEAALGAGRT